MATAKANFELVSFDESTVTEFDDGGKLTRATVTQRLTGEMEGEVVDELLMYYWPDGTTEITGFSRFTGRIGDRSGGYVGQAAGHYDGSEVHGTASVLPGSGTRGLSGLRGEVESGAPHGSTGWIMIDYQLD
jgi:Protein of unknown function (DUF3224)